MSERDAREESMRMALSSKEIRHALSFAATTPPKVLRFRWEELRWFVPYIGEFNSGNVVRYLCASHGMLDVDAKKLNPYQIADLIQADAEKYKARMDNPNQNSNGDTRPKSNEPPNPAERQAETMAGGDGTGDELQKRVASLERHRKKHAKPLTKTEKDRNQRIKFCCPRRRKNPKDTWNEIYHDYAEKFPSDKTASPDTLLHSHDRNCLKCRELKS